MFNVLNVVNYAAPANGGTTSAYASPALFGTSGGTPDVANGAPVFGTAGPRKIQLGAKFIFQSCGNGVTLGGANMPSAPPGHIALVTSLWSHARRFD